jgi:hypothetical protein
MCAKQVMNSMSARTSCLPSVLQPLGNHIDSSCSVRNVLNSSDAPTKDSIAGNNASSSFWKWAAGSLANCAARAAFHESMFRPAALGEYQTEH